MSSIIYGYTTSLALPAWSSFERKDFSDTKICTAHIDDVLVAYCEFTTCWVFKEMSEDPETADVNVGSIEYLEVHPDYRRRGIATELLTHLYSEFPDKTFVAEIVDSARDFYAAAGFVLFFKDYGSEQCTVIRGAGGLDVEQLYWSYEMSHFYEDSENDFLMGCVWSGSEERWIRPNRSYVEEKEAVASDPWEIETVAVQTPELQRIALEQLDDAIIRIRNPDKEVTDALSEQLRHYIEDCHCSEREHSLCIPCPLLAKAE